MTNARNDTLFGDLRGVLSNGRDQVDGQDDRRALRSDSNRQRRTGIPEVVFAASKPPPIVAEALEQLAGTNGRAMASRVSEDAVAELRGFLEPRLTVEYVPLARGLVASIPGVPPPNTGGVVGILSAGTSDLPIAAEAALMATEMGSRVLEAWDVGVAG